MHTLRKTSVLTVALALVLALLFGVLTIFGSKLASAADPITDPGAPSGDGVNPVLIQNNPTCASLGNYLELKVEPVVNGSYPSSNGYLTATIANIRDEGAGPIFDWSSTRGVDRVIVKGGDAADAYVYTPEDMADTKLHAPVNPNNGDYFGLSHVSFCYDVEPQVSKTATTTFTRTYNWTIDKSVTPETWDLFKGDSGKSKYTVSVNQTGSTDSNWAVSGKITVTNPLNNSSINIGAIQDVVSQGTNTTANVTNCTSNNNPVTFPFSLPANGTLECSYSANLGSGTNGTNTATATASGTGIANGVGTANVTFGNPTTEVNKTVTVKDNFEGDETTLGTTNASKTFEYDRTFTCEADEGEHNNTATVYGNNNTALGNASAKVTVNCYDLAVSKTAETSSTRKYDWTIDKTADKTDLTLATEETSPVNYTVKLNATPQDSFQVSGKITISNPNPSLDAKLKEVTDVISSNIQADVDCPSLTVPKNDGTLECTYTADVPDGEDRTNTATATLNNYAYDSAGNPGNDPIGTTDFSSDPVDVVFGAPTLIDEKVDVSDTLQGNLGSVEATTDTLPREFKYTRDVGPYDTCGDKPPIDNTASFVTNTTGATGSDDWTVNVKVKCKLTVIKQLVPETDSGKFNLQIDGVTKAANVGDEGTTGAVPVALGTHTVGETAGTNTNLSDYVSKINCGGADVNGTSTTVSFASGDTDKTCTITNTRKGKAEVIKKVSGAAPAAGQTFTFELRKDASITSNGTILETKTTDASGNIGFTTSLVPGDTYQICEWVMPGWNTNLAGDGPLFVPGSMTTPTLPNPNVNNMTVCTNFTVEAGQTRTFNVDNTPPPGGRALTIGFWKNWASCASSAGKGQKPMLDLTLGIASKNTANPPGGLVVSADSGSPPTLWPNYAATWSLVLKGDPMSTINNIKPALDCSKAVNLLNKTTINGTKKASDPLFNMTAQLVAAQLNRFMGAGISGITITNIDRAVLLNGKYNFNGNTYSPKLTTADTNLANCLATQLDNYNNNRPVSNCP
jgi:hypothetical protein